ncbi:ADP-ribosylglycohydrolase family protein [Herbidospora cretacea]|uniref:ADP-ribosylglycohydrolase family protein n=1 Tax=Herbidospora cretacea TaxID=28444 RepID=UPI000AECABF8|nr:ADP-ribosylglycohydrolase family protein [Herbidospora cretacea]
MTSCSEDVNSLIFSSVAGRRRGGPGGRRAGITRLAVGGDTDTVAAVTGGLAGAVYGLPAIPGRWTSPLHVPLPGGGGRVLRLPDLLELAGRLDSGRAGR